MSSRITVLLLFPLFTLTGILHSAEISGPESELRDVLKMHENRGGFAVTVGDDSHGIFYQLSLQNHYAVHGLFRSEETLSTMRKRLMAERRYGKNCVALWSDSDLPFVENMVSLFICKDEAFVSRAEILRVLSPGGMALFPDGE